MLLSVKNELGVPFTVRVVHQGDRYGRDNVVVHEEQESLVEFYDARFPFYSDPSGKVLGQFVSRYQVSTIAEGSGGLVLDGGCHEWSLSCSEMKQVRSWLSS